MPLSTGTRLGPYEIIAPIGAGGMGEVYKGRDTRLDRIVAIKVLAAHLDSAAARDRFEQEARAVSSLNHPHICTLHDVGHQDGIDYLVMEYLEGETLADRLNKGPVAIDKLLEYGKQIAGALDQAHRLRVIHRDLKPANIMLTKSGAKLLDFGLAKMTQRENVPSGSAALTLTRPLTAEGSIVGTFQYLAPERIEGKEADSRGDIFALGAVLYEMATGCRAFEGRTQASVIAAILEREPPPISTSQPMTPRALDYLVKSCLAKDPDERMQSAHDVLLQLRWIDVAQDSGMQAAGRRPTTLLPWMLAGFLAVVAVILFFVYRRSPHEELRSLKLTVLPPEKATFDTNRLLAVSPNGRHIAFTVGTGSEIRQLWIRDLDGLVSRLLPGTEGAISPFWSPDSRHIAFFAGGKLKRIEVTGGPAQTLCDASGGRGGSWSPSGVIVFTPGFTDGLYRVESTGGNATAVTTLDPSLGEISHRWPCFLPDGHHFLYLARNAEPEKSALYVADLESKDRRRILGASSNAVYTSPGFLLFMRERTLMAQSFDSNRAQITGNPVPVAEGVDFVPLQVQADFSVSQNGVLAYYPAGTGLNSQLTWFDRSGNALGTIGEPGAFVQPTISPDGSAVAVDRADPRTGNSDIWLYDLARGTASRFTFDPKQDLLPVWSPDGSRIVFRSNRDGPFNLYEKSVTSAGKEERLLVTPYDKYPTHWSRDGRFLIFDQMDAKTKADIWVLPLFGDRKPFPFLQSEFNESLGSLSPDGRWLAYTSDEAGRDEVYVQSFPATGAKLQISTNGGVGTRWNRDGKELFYIAADRKLMAVQVRTGDRFEAGVPRPLFEVPRGHAPTFDISPDGRRFLVFNTPEETTAPPMIVVVNWSAVMKK